MELTIECQKRPADAKPKAIRRQGLIPAVLYGHQGTESVSLVVDGRQVERLLRHAVVNSSVIQLDVPDMAWSGKTLLREVQSHPWKGSVYHLSFFSFAAHGSIDVTLPVQFVGIAEGVKTNGGMLDTVFTELVVQGQPDRMPTAIEVDVTALDIGDVVRVRDLNLPEGVQTQVDADTIIASVLQGRVSAEDAAAEA